MSSVSQRLASLGVRSVESKVDRRALRRGEIIKARVDDPGPRGKVDVLRRIKGDPLARLHARGQIDEAQYQAGRIFQRDVELAEPGAHQVDLVQPRVDCSGRPELLTDKQQKARRRLDEAERVLGRMMFRIARAVLIDGMSTEQLASLFNREGEIAEKYYGRIFRDALDIIAVENGLASEMRIPLGGT